MSKRMGFDVEREMKHLKKIVERDDSVKITSRFTKYLIEQAERNVRNHKAIEQIKHIVLHPLSKTWNKDEALYRIENILMALESESNE